MKATLFFIVVSCAAWAAVCCGRKDAPADQPKSAVDVKAQNDATGTVGQEQKTEAPAPQPAASQTPAAQTQDAKTPAPIEALQARVTDKKIVISGKVMFEYNQAIIRAESFGLLDGVATALKKHPEIIRIRIEGHTDSDGDDNYNKQLSKKRAESVLNYLAKAGIKESRLTATGFGEEMPIASNDTEDGKEKNRRVEFTIIERAKPVAATWTSSTVKPGVIESREATDDETEAAVKKMRK